MLQRIGFLKNWMLLLVNFSAIDPIWAMDMPILVPVKKEPCFDDYVPQRQLFPMISIERIKKVFADKGITINPKNFTNNCVDCAISCYRWLNDRTEKPQQITKYKKSGKNMECN